MADFVLKYADGRGQIHQQVATAPSEKELRERYSQQGFLIYSIKPRVARWAVSMPCRPGYSPCSILRLPSSLAHHPAPAAAAVAGAEGAAEEAVAGAAAPQDSDNKPFFKMRIT